MTVEDMVQECKNNFDCEDCKAHADCEEFTNRIRRVVTPDDLSDFLKYLDEKE